MRFLLDTHAFIWTISEPTKLTRRVREAIGAKANPTYVSAVSFWEITIKTRIGKLDLGWTGDLVSEAERAGIEPISLAPDEAATYDSLVEASHNDPFDRMLAWQAIRRKYILISRDPEFRKFQGDGLKLIWS